MNNQKIKADKGKPRVSLTPSAIVWCIAPVREYGMDKYPEGGKDNWKRVEPERYIDALYRHVLALWKTLTQETRKAVCLTYGTLEAI